MKIFKIVFYFLILNSHLSFGRKLQTKSLATSIYDIVNEFYIKQEKHFNILVFGKKSKEITDILNGFLKLCVRKKLSVSIDVIRNVRKKSILSFDYATIFLFDDFKSFLKFEDISTKSAQSRQRNSKFLVYCRNAKTIDYLKFYAQPDVINLAVGGTEIYNYFLVEFSNQEIHLNTIEYFTELACNKLQFKTLNEFVIKKKKWMKNLAVPEKFMNFHNCMICVLADIGQFYTYSHDGSVRGFLHEITNILKERGNFSVYYEEKFMESDLNTSKSIWRTKIKNGKILDAQLSINNIKSLFVFSMYTKMHMTTTFDEICLVFLITPPEKLSNLEKILLPFDDLTWILLMAIFFCSFFVISILSFKSKHLKNIVIGVNVKAPSLNVIGTFFGISQNNMPKRNFARYILMNFILFCLIIRTAYQGVLFEMIASDIRKKLPETIDDLVDRNFTVICWLEAHIDICSILNVIDPEKR